MQFGQNGALFALLAVCSLLAAFALSRRALPRYARRVALALCWALAVLAMAGGLAELTAAYWWDAPVLVRVDGYWQYRPGHYLPLPNARIEAVVHNPGWKRPVALTNQDGLRTTVAPFSRRAGERRVLLLGDSYLFGLGLDAEETVAARLQERLRAADPGSHWVVINGGVAGYNLFSEFDLFDWLIDRYRPDVTVFMVQRDDLLPDLNDSLRDERPRRVRALSRFALFRFVKTAISYLRYHHQLEYDYTGRVVIRPDLLAARETRLRAAVPRFDANVARSRSRVIFNGLDFTFNDDVEFESLQGHMEARFTPWNRDMPGLTIPGDGHPSPEGARYLAAYLAPIVLAPSPH